jgi:glycine cleavage system H protein
MSNSPDHLKYTKEHEWVEEREGGLIRMGITDFAQGALGDIVYIQLPKVGEMLVAGAVCGEVESTKSVSEIYAPVSGKVVAVNSDLDKSPESLNVDPYGAGWIADVEISSTPSDLLSASEYSELTA